MINATTIARRIEDSVDWYRQHRWPTSIAVAVVLVLMARYWLAADRLDAKQILASVSRELHTTFTTHDRLEDGGKEIAKVINVTRRLADREPLSYSYSDPLTLMAIGHCMAVLLPGEMHEPEPQDKCKVFVRRLFTSNESMVDALAPWIGNDEDLAVIVDPSWKRVNGCVMGDNGSHVLCLILAR